MNFTYNFFLNKLTIIYNLMTYHFLNIQHIVVQYIMDIKR